MRQKSNPMSVFDIFEKARAFTLDPFWIEVFSDCACNKFPKGIRYDQQKNNIIVKTSNGKTEVIGLSQKKPEIVFQTMMWIFKEKCDMISTRDLKVRKKKMDDKLKDDLLENCKFKDIKPRNLKDRLIMDYISSLKLKHNLNDLEFSKLISTVQLAIQFKSINASNDIEYFDGKVQDIKGLVFDEEKREFKTPEFLFSTKGSKNKSEKMSQDIFISNVKKFFQENNIRAKKFKQV